MTLGDHERENSLYPTHLDAHPSTHYAKAGRVQRLLFERRTVNLYINHAGKQPFWCQTPLAAAGAWTVWERLLITFSVSQSAIVCARILSFSLASWSLVLAALGSYTLDHLLDSS